jgi:sulfate transport system substrate-binding protein
VPANDVAAATQFVGTVLRNVKIMDRGARESMLTFERGTGDAIISYENEIVVGKAKGGAYDMVLPDSTILIENPAAVVDKYANKHGSKDAANALLAYLWSPEAQRLYANNGLRPVVPSVVTEVAGRFPPVADLFTVADLGGWPAVQKAVFADGAVYDQALEKSRSAAP